MIFSLIKISIIYTYHTPFEAVRGIEIAGRKNGDYPISTIKTANIFANISYK